MHNAECRYAERRGDIIKGIGYIECQPLVCWFCFGISYVAFVAKMTIV
jgi:hypothetical protein